MFLHYRTVGIVLDKADYREVDQILIVYTKDFGKIEILGRGIRKISSKLRPQIDLLTLSELEFIQGKIYKTLTDAILINKFSNIKNSLPKLKIAFAICELINKLTPPQERDSQQSNLIFSAFDILNNIRMISKEKLVLFYFYFFWNFIANIGYAPDFSCCYLCHNKIKRSSVIFFSNQGEILCSTCGKKYKKGLIKLDSDLLKIFGALVFQNKDWPQISNIKLTSDKLSILIKICQSYLTNLYES